VVLGTREAWWDDEDALPAQIASRGVEFIFTGLQELFRADDLTLVNLECVIKANSKDENKSKEYRFRGLPEWLTALMDAGIDVVNIANNHYVDYGKQGRDETRASLDAAGIPFAGYGYLCTVEIDGHLIGFGGCRETEWLKNKKQIRTDADALRAMGCEVIIYSCHWGTEYAPMHNSTQQLMAEACAEAGIDIVVGTHPHVVQGITSIDRTVVLWSLGNLMFGGTKEMTTFDGAMASLKLRFDSQGYKGVSVTYVPVLTSGSAPENDYSPKLASGEDAERILKKIQLDSDYLIADEMFFSRTDGI